MNYKSIELDEMKQINDRFKHRLTRHLSLALRVSRSFTPDGDETDKHDSLPPVLLVYLTGYHPSTRQFTTATVNRSLSHPLETASELDALLIRTAM